jgi:hypothetical protein
LTTTLNFAHKKRTTVLWRFIWKILGQNNSLRKNYKLKKTYRFSQITGSSTVSLTVGPNQTIVIIFLRFLKLFNYQFMLKKNWNYSLIRLSYLSTQSDESFSKAELNINVGWKSCWKAPESTVIGIFQC